MRFFAGAPELSDDDDDIKTDSHKVKQSGVDDSQEEIVDPIREKRRAKKRKANAKKLAKKHAEKAALAAAAGDKNADTQDLNQSGTSDKKKKKKQQGQEGNSHNTSAEPQRGHQGKASVNGKAEPNGEAHNNQKESVSPSTPKTFYDPFSRRRIVVQPNANAGGAQNKSMAQQKVQGSGGKKQQGDDSDSSSASPWPSSDDSDSSDDDEKKTPKTDEKKPPKTDEKKTPKTDEKKTPKTIKESANKRAKSCDSSSSSSASESESDSSQDDSKQPTKHAKAAANTSAATPQRTMFDPFSKKKIVVGSGTPQGAQANTAQTTPANPSKHKAREAATWSSSDDESDGDKRVPANRDATAGQQQTSASKMAPSAQKKKPASSSSSSSADSDSDSESSDDDTRGAKRAKPAGNNGSGGSTGTPAAPRYIFDPFSKKKILVGGTQGPAQNTQQDLAGKDKVNGGKKRGAEREGDADEERGSKKAKGGSHLKGGHEAAANSPHAKGGHVSDAGAVQGRGSQRSQHKVPNSDAKSAPNSAQDTSKMSAGEKRKAEKKQAKVIKFDHSDEDDEEEEEEEEEEQGDVKAKNAHAQGGSKNSNARDKENPDTSATSDDQHKTKGGSNDAASQGTARRKDENQGAKKLSNEGAKKPEKEKHILFVGQLPYSATKESVFAHFKGCTENGRPMSVRMLTDKTTNKPRGIAFVEFENEEDANRALLLDYSTVGGRRIRVERTAKGAGNAKERREVLSKLKTEQMETKKQLVSNAVHEAMKHQPQDLQDGLTRSDLDDRVCEFLHTLPIEVVKTALKECAALELGGVQNRSAYVMGLLKSKAMQMGGE